MSDQNAALFDKLDGFYVTKSEHDWLERRFSNMTEKEKILFQGAMELEISISPVPALTISMGPHQV